MSHAFTRRTRRTEVKIRAPRTPTSQVRSVSKIDKSTKVTPHALLYPPERILWSLWLAASLFLCLNLWRFLRVTEVSNQSSLFWSRLYIYGEIATIVNILVDEAWKFIAVVHGHSRPHLRLEGDQVPGVDVIITSCGEERAVILNTIRAACCLDYPLDRFQVILSDDKADKLLEVELRAMCKEFRNLHYYARVKPKDSFHGAKAGNLNSAMCFAATMTEEPHEWLAAMDADMIAERHMLRTLLPHGMQAPDVGMVASGQHNYNLQPNDPLCQNMDWYWADQSLMDSVNAGNCFGTGFIVRRNAIESIGGFPYSISDDVLCSMMLEQHGWKMAVIDEKVQWGMAPDSILGHLIQRRKWNAGNLNNSIKLKFCLGPSKMTLQQRILGFAYCWRNFGYIVKFALHWTRMISVFMATPLIIVSGRDQLRLLLVTFGARTVLRCAYEATVSRKYGYRVLRREFDNQLWLSTHIAFSGLKELRAIFFGGKLMTFTVTGSTMSNVRNQDHAEKRNIVSPPKRMATFLADEQIYLSATGNILAILVVVLRSSLKAVSSLPKQSEIHDVWHALTVTALWPGNLFLVQLSSFFIPLLHAYFRLPVPDSRSLLEEDLDGVLRPRASRRTLHWDAWSWVMELPHILVILHATVTFVALSQ